MARSVPDPPSSQMPQDLVLGLDVGTNSVGWALIRSNREAQGSLVDSGVRIFSAGLANFGTNKEASLASARRLARGARRQTMRRKRRRKKVYGLLARHGQLPLVESQDPGAIRAALDGVDARLRANHCPAGDDMAHQMLPYRLRALALQRPLASDELGRALYHLAQRRGFQSNRKTDRAADEEELGRVKQGISDLRGAMIKAGAPTLGAYFAGLDPHAERIRQRYTDRSMYREEFQAIRAVQEPAQAGLSPEFWDALERTLFHQRPLRSSAHLVGRCSLEPTKPRAPLWSDLANRVRILQDVNHLRVSIADGDERPLTPEERDKVIEHLSVHDRVTWAKLGQVLGLKRSTFEFNLQRGERKHLEGHATAARLRPIVGPERWDVWTSEQRDALAHQVDSIEKPEALRGVAKALGLDGEDETAFLRVRLPQGRARHCTKAYRRILPHLEAGLSYAEAADRAYPSRRRHTDVLPRLPLVQDFDPELRNPMVARTLSELRKVVNELIARYGKPDLVRIEMARDLKRGKKARDEIARRIAANKRLREKALGQITARCPGLRNPTREDVQKVLLAEECRWICPYTGRGFGMDDLFGPTPTMDVEHIVPFSRCFDDSFANRTLCDVQENRHRKGNRTPFEAYGHDEPRFREMLQRVAGFDRTYASRRSKLDRFKARTEEEWDLDEFCSRQLVDTAYAARLGAEYLGTLYGGEVDAQGRRRVQATSGRVTAYLRRLWGTETLLGDHASTGKSRDDHRHHALDAAVVALTSPSAVKRLADAAQAAERQRLRRPFAEIPQPWNGFRDELGRSLRRIVVSHRTQRGLNGSLHEESNYSPKGGDGKGWIRIPVAKLAEKHLPDLPDAALRIRLAEWLRAGKPEPGPVIVDRNGGRRVLRRVRSRASRSIVPLGRGPSLRYVAPASNHHVEVLERLDGQGGFETHLVTRLEAVDRRRQGLPVVRRDWGEDRRFLFSLHSGDCIGRAYGPGWDIIRISAISDGLWEGLRASDARSSTDVREAGVSGGRLKKNPNSFLKDGFRKVDLSPSGRVTWNHE